MNIYLSKDGQQTGPFPLEEVQRRLATGEVLPTQLAWYQGAPGWGPISAVPGIGPLPTTVGGTAPGAGGAVPVATAGASGGARLGGGGMMGGAMGGLVSSAGLKQGGGGFFGALFDFSFTSFVTPKIIKVLFILGVLVVSLYAIGMLLIGLFSMVRGAIGSGLGMLIVAPIIFVLGICYVRVLLEVMVAIFRIAENTSQLAQHTNALVQHQQARDAEKQKTSGAAGVSAGGSSVAALDKVV